MTYVILCFNGQFWYSIKETPNLQRALSYAKNILNKEHALIKIIDHEGQLIQTLEYES